MNDGYPTTETPATASQPSADAPRPAAFCQDCGRPLTPDTLRTVGSGVFCDPCLHARVAAPAPVVPGPVVPGPANPVLAGLLGVIPGVGAMYNGQFIKGFVHLIIFAVLVSLSDHVSGVFGIFVAAWVIYQVFEAFNTARARRDGLPLPDPIGFNDLSDHIGATWRANAASARPPVAQNPPPPPYTPAPPANWAGYVPPTAFAQSPPVAVPYTQPAPAQPWQPVPYADTFTAPPSAPLAPLPPASRLPIGAFWLIGLGVVILLANFVPDLRFSGRWFVPVVLGALAVYIFTRRLGTGVSVLSRLRAPAVLMTLAVLFTLQALDAATLGQTWPVIVIVIGLLLLLERTVAARSLSATPTPAAAYSIVPPADPSTATENPRASFTAPDDSTKGGI